MQQKLLNLFDFSAPISELQKNQKLILVNAGNPPAKNFVVASLAQKLADAKIFWAADGENFDAIAANAKFFFNGEIAILPEKIDTRQFYELQKKINSRKKILFLFKNAEKILQQKFPSPQFFDEKKIILRRGQKINFFEIFSQLEKINYFSADAEKIFPGEFVRRGDDFFIFPVNENFAAKIKIAENKILEIENFLQNSDEKIAKKNWEKLREIFKNEKNFDEKKIEKIAEFLKNEKKIDAEILAEKFKIEKKIAEKICEKFTKNGGEKIEKKNLEKLEIWPTKIFKNENENEKNLLENLTKKNLIFISEDFDAENLENLRIPKNFLNIKLTTFPRENEKFFHLNFFSVLPFYTQSDFVVDVKERLRRDFQIFLATKKLTEIKKIFDENKIMFSENLENKNPSTVKILQIPEKNFLPHSFQNSDQKILFLSDREIFKFRRSQQKKAVAGVNFDLMTSLKPGNFVVHTEHGLAKFSGIVRKNLGANFGEREFLELNYAANDKLFVPVESAEKITKFIGDEAPKLTRLGSAEWKNSQKKIKKETEKIAGELLKLYAAREISQSKKFPDDDEMMKNFCDSFSYEPTPGQSQTWSEVRADLEKSRPMDRLVCGDVGFGKTEIAMRAAFKAFRAGRQTAFLAPITILAEQHFRSFEKRIAKKNYGVKIALLSRLQKNSEQKKILENLAAGKIDILIGTHRLLSDDVKFKNLGLLIIDEEQRFGVKQKEKLKKLRTSVDLLTLTATPIPRTLNMGLHKLKDISTITTPPPGRLPIVTEVRKFNLNLIREKILAEKSRGGQIYFLHNAVRTIDGTAEQLQKLIPEIKIIVAHGQLPPHELERRVKKFKNGAVDVLVASTIIENGIDLPNANTLIVNRAEKFGLSQLYQLRGRVGRGRRQAFAFFLYHGQKLKLESKKRLRAIVEANELGSGFQIAMRDLEIRGAGEILGASQSGAIKTVGISHFMRMLNQTIEKMKSGEISEKIEEEIEENISVEIPLSAFIPPNFIPNADEKIQIYKELASAENPENLAEMKKDLELDYGKLPTEVENLCKIIFLKMKLRDANLAAAKVHQIAEKKFEILLRMSKNFSAEQIFSLLKNSKFRWKITASAIKLQLEKLPIEWFEIFCREIDFLRAKNSAKNLEKIKN